MTLSATPNLYKHHQFPGEIISHAVWLYFRFPLSHRDVEELLLASPKNRRNLLRQAVFPWLISACEDNQKTWVK
jgi:transposase-like protein